VTRRRRPSGEPAPLPRGRGWTGAVWLAAITLAVGIVLSIGVRTDAWSDLGASIVRSLRVDPGSDAASVAKWFDALAGYLFVVLLRCGTLVVAAWFRRWRQALFFLATFVITDWVVVRALGVARPDPGLAPLSDRATFWFPSRPVATFAVTVSGMAFVLVPAGKRRRVALWLGGVVAALVAIARIVLAADYPIDAVYAIAVGFTVPIAVFAYFVPDDVFPVSYRRGGTAAHLDLGGERGAAIVRAMADQLGLTVTELEPFGLEGSGGSSPLRMRVAELEGRVFAKVYSTSHLRADRWYRMGRTMLYGQLEDEVPFSSVRRLVEYEDYALRLLDDVGIRVAHTYGVVELTPNREYMLVTEFFEGSKNLGDSEIDDGVVDEGIQLVRRLWSEGLAHRDLKPANLLVKEGHLQLVDVSGLEVRPTPWRQAVDLANMMLTLALQTDPDRVYARAVLAFTPDEIGEAFASAVGLAVPTQVQQRLKSDPRPLVQRFKELGPPHDPVSIQRWSARRVGLAAGSFLAVLVLAAMVLDVIRAGVA
jgi:membrane-associated phospholipid phosphatase/tRNA A-37 threonylcarbamoyl transferase component Bud32